MFEKNYFITQLISFVESLFFFLFCFVLRFFYNSSSHIKSGKKVSQLRTEEKLIFGSSLLFRLQSSLHKKLPSMATPRPPYFLLNVPETVRQIQCVLRHFVITTHFEIIYAQSYLVTKFKNIIFFSFLLRCFYDKVEISTIPSRCYYKLRRRTIITCRSSNYEVCRSYLLQNAAAVLTK